MCDRKSSRWKYNIWELLLNDFELRNYATEATKKIYYAKGEGNVDHITVTKWFKKFHSSCKNFNDQAKKRWFRGRTQSQRREYGK